MDSECYTAEPVEAAEVANLLWTGGWDSTFRLLDLVPVHGSTVQPWYILDEERRSTEFEIDAMLRIRTSLAAQNADAAARVLPTHYRLASQQYLGSQYEWLACLVLGESPDEIGLSVHCEDKAYAFVAPHAERVSRSWGQTYKLRSGVDHTSLRLFRPFSFPLFNWTKVQMQEHATEQGFQHLMDLTWFCHSPQTGKPYNKPESLIRCVDLAVTPSRRGSPTAFRARSASSANCGSSGVPPNSGWV